MLMNVPYDVFWHLTPKKLSYFVKAFDMKEQKEDENRWWSGAYTMQAVEKAVINAISVTFGNRHAGIKYLDKPILKDFYEDLYLSEEEKQDKMIQEAIKQEELWILNNRQLPKIDLSE